jgi:hypothetical protein
MSFVRDADWHHLIQELIQLTKQAPSADDSERSRRFEGIVRTEVRACSI